MVVPGAVPNINRRSTLVLGPFLGTQRFVPARACETCLCNCHGYVRNRKHTHTRTVMLPLYAEATVITTS